MFYKPTLIEIIQIKPPVFLLQATVRADYPRQGTNKIPVQGNCNCQGESSASSFEKQG